MKSIRSTERQMRKLQRQRHLYDIQMMVLANPLFKNLNSRDQKVLVGLIYKAELIETYMRDNSVVRVNDSFDKIVQDVADMLNDALDNMHDDEDDDFK